jgi:hypothetical protein
MLHKIIESIPSLQSPLNLFVNRTLIHESCSKYLNHSTVSKNLLTIYMDVLYNILIEGIFLQLVKLIKMYLNETYSRVQVGRHLYR